MSKDLYDKEKTHNWYKQFNDLDIHIEKKQFRKRRKVGFGYMNLNINLIHFVTYVSNWHFTIYPQKHSFSRLLILTHDIHS